MSCSNEADCREAAKRRSALGVLALMLAIFLTLSIWSFLPSRNQVTPDLVQYQGVGAVEGKRVFQAYNCMGCHTIVGNGAYFGPDLTRIYADAGSAWLAAFLPSAGGWPTAGAVQVKLQDPAVQKDSGTADMQVYRQQYPGAAERLDRRGGQQSLMPNLPLQAREIKALIAFLKYASAMHTEGWPPRPNANRRLPQAVSGRSSAAKEPFEAEDKLAHGRQLVGDLGCLACHATDRKRLVGPGWGGLFGSQVELADGAKVTADEAYLIESIRQPDAKLVAGYPLHVMPSYDALIKEPDLQAILAYLRSL